MSRDPSILGFCHINCLVPYGMLPGILKTVVSQRHLVIQTALTKFIRFTNSTNSMLDLLTKGV